MRQVEVSPERTLCACGCGRPVGHGRRRFASDDCRRRQRRRERVREPAEYAAALLRMLRMIDGNRVFDADAFGELAKVDTRLHDLLREKATQLVAAGYSWGEIGRACGMTRQAARQRWGRQ